MSVVGFQLTAQRVFDLADQVGMPVDAVTKDGPRDRIPDQVASTLPPTLRFAHRSNV